VLADFAETDEFVSHDAQRKMAGEITRTVEILRNHGHRRPARAIDDAVAVSHANP